MKNTCSVCKHFDTVKGFCRAHPPVMNSGRTFWPEVHSDDWCSEFMDKDAVDVAVLSNELKEQVAEYCEMHHLEFTGVEGNVLIFKQLGP